MAARMTEGGRDALEAMPIHPRHAKRMPEDVKRALVEDAELLDPHGVAMSLLHTSTSSVRSDVGENRVPTLLVAGVHEESFVEPMHFARDNMPSVEIVEVDAGHAVNIQAAEAFNAAVLHFFGKRQ
jgi:pimeloyl-ACP methyl ester carboxylesterase